MASSSSSLFFLLSILYTLFTAAKSNNSSDQIVLSTKPRERSPILINSPNGTESGVYNKQGIHMLLSEVTETYLTVPWMTYFFPSVYILVFVLGLPLNILAILLFVIKEKLQKPATVYMFNLAIADLLVLSVLPFKIAFHVERNEWTFRLTLCRLVEAAFTCNMFCSILLITGISTDRFLVVVCPLKAMSCRTRRCASGICFAIWLVAIAGAMPVLIVDPTNSLPQLNMTTCLDVLNIFAITTYVGYSVALSVLFFVIPLLITTTCYVCIIRQLSLSNGVVNTGRKRRAILLSGAVLCTFIFCFGPSNVLILMQMFLPQQNLHNLFFAYMMSLSLSTFSCCLDPLIYYYSSSEFQRCVWRVLCKRKHYPLEKDSQIKPSNVTTFLSGTDN